MKALQFRDAVLSVSEVPRPVPTSEAVIKVIASGICATDIEISRGYADFEGTLGHEFIGIVESSSDNTELIGQRVVGEINVGCGTCSVCRTGDERHCRRRTVLGIAGRDGAHAEYVSLPSKNLVRVPDSVSDDAAVFAEPLAAAVGVTEQISVSSETKVAVVGDGNLGILCAKALSLFSSHITLVGKHPTKLEKVRGDTETMLVEELPSNHSSRFDVVIEASASESGIETAVDLVRPRGQIVLKSTFHGKPAWPASRIVVDEISIVGSRCGRLGPALELLESGRVSVDSLISDEFDLGDALSAFERAKQPGVLKVLLRPSNRK